MRQTEAFLDAVGDSTMNGVEVNDMVNSQIQEMSEKIDTHAKDTQSFLQKQYQLLNLSM